MRLFAARLALFVAPVYLPERALRLCLGFAMNVTRSAINFCFHVLWRYLRDTAHNVAPDSAEARNNIRSKLGGFCRSQLWRTVVK